MRRRKRDSEGEGVRGERGKKTDGQTEGWIETEDGKKEGRKKKETKNTSRGASRGGDRGDRNRKETSDVVCPIAITPSGTFLRQRQSVPRKSFKCIAVRLGHCENFEIATYGFLPIER